MTIRDDYEEIGASIGRLIQEKQAAYGDSFNRSNEILRVLYPEGVTPDKYRDFLAVTRVIDKLFRIATDRDALGESPWRDVMGYALLSLAHQEEERVISFTPDEIKKAVISEYEEVYGVETPPKIAPAPRGGRQQKGWAQQQTATAGQTTTVVNTEVPADHKKR